MWHWRLSMSAEMAHCIISPMSVTDLRIYPQFQPNRDSISFHLSSDLIKWILWWIFMAAAQQLNPSLEGEKTKKPKPHLCYSIDDKSRPFHCHLREEGKKKKKKSKKSRARVICAWLWHICTYIFRRAFLIWLLIRATFCIIEFIATNFCKKRTDGKWHQKVPTGNSRRKSDCIFQSMTSSSVNLSHFIVINNQPPCCNQLRQSPCWECLVVWFLKLCSCSPGTSLQFWLI